MTHLPISVLMSVYSKDNPAQFSHALHSNTEGQIKFPSEFVLVVDGPVSNLINVEIANFVKVCESLCISLKIIRIEKNSGLAHALNTGLEQCSYKYIARADADDLSFPNRFMVQWEQAIMYPDVDIHFSYHAEFEESPKRIDCVKVCPTEHTEIVRALKRRCVISHPTIMYKRETIKEVGGYRTDVGFFEDYDLHLRLIKFGSIFSAVPQPLVLVRVSHLQRVRRGGISYAFKELKARTRLWNEGVIGTGNYALYSLLYFLFRLSPPVMKRVFYRFFRAKPVSFG